MTLKQYLENFINGIPNKNKFRDLYEIEGQKGCRILMLMARNRGPYILGLRLYNNIIIFNSGDNSGDYYAVNKKLERLEIYNRLKQYYFYSLGKLDNSGEDITDSSVVKIWGENSYEIKIGNTRLFLIESPQNKAGRFFSKEEVFSIYMGEKTNLECTKKTIELKNYKGGPLEFFHKLNQVLPNKSLRLQENIWARPIENFKPPVTTKKEREILSEWPNRLSNNFPLHILRDEENQIKVLGDKYKWNAEHLLFQNKMKKYKEILERVKTRAGNPESSTFAKYITPVQCERVYLNSNQYMIKGEFKVGKRFDRDKKDLILEDWHEIFELSLDEL